MNFNFDPNRAFSGASSSGASTQFTEAQASEALLSLKQAPPDVFHPYYASSSRVWGENIGFADFTQLKEFKDELDKNPHKTLPGHMLFNFFTNQAFAVDLFAGSADLTPMIAFIQKLNDHQKNLMSELSDRQKSQIKRPSITFNIYAQNFTIPPQIMNWYRHGSEARAFACRFYLVFHHSDCLPREVFHEHAQIMNEDLDARSQYKRGASQLSIRLKRKTFAPHLFAGFNLTRRVYT